MVNQERLPPIAAEMLSADQQAAAEEFKSGRGYPVMGPFAVMLRSPQVMLRAANLGRYLRYQSVLPQRIRELVILLTAREWTQQFEWSHHYKYAMEAGLAAQVADAIAEGRRPQRMAEDEAAAYDFSIELHHRKSVSDATYARALAQFGEQGVVDMVGINGYYSLLAMMMNVARTPSDTDAVKPLEPFPR
jgi:4-carboxymuconolactone decarboxylase